MPNERYLLWSGGMDSTYLLLRFLALGSRVVPVYLVMNSNRCEGEMELRKRIRAAISGSMTGNLATDLVLRPDALQGVASNLRMELQSLGIIAGSRRENIGLQSVWQVAAAKTLNARLYSGMCADDNLRHADWILGNGVSLPLNGVRKATVARHAIKRGWLGILSMTVSCIMFTDRHCGACVECNKRRRAGMLEQHASV